jgi:hypothetical protein
MPTDRPAPYNPPCGKFGLAHWNIIYQNFDTAAPGGLEGQFQKSAHSEETMTNAATAPVQAPSNGYRWMQLIIGVVCMGMIANLQYGWTYFVSPMAKAHSWDVGSIQVAFSIFVALETWLTPL